MGIRKLHYDPLGWDDNVWVVCFVNDPDNWWDGQPYTAGEAMRRANELNEHFRCGETTQYVTVREIGPNDSYIERMDRIAERAAAYWAGPGATGIAASSSSLAGRGLTALQQQTKEGRWLQFPDDESVGMVYWFDPASVPDAPLGFLQLAEEHKERWRSGKIQQPQVGVSAQGRVFAPTGDFAHLDIYSRDNLAFLDGCDPFNLVAAVTARGIGWCKDPLCHLAAIKSLRWLMLDRAWSVDCGMECLASIESLEGLKIKVSYATSVELNALAKLPSLTYLEIEDSNFKGLQSLPASLVSLRLGFGDQKGLQCIAALPKLKELEIGLSEAEISVGVISDLARIPSLESLHIDVWYDEVEFLSTHESDDEDGLLPEPGWLNEVLLDELFNRLEAANDRWESILPPKVQLSWSTVGELSMGEKPPSKQGLIRSGME
jgi:hypothetical protein